ncbi:MAG TPA: SGNH/GDSL hydrolase family protein [Phycisphaerae bacterium]|nr:SGNH/GDSL hydrolase family protein [Phycisphaerae bacterium]
MTCAGCTTPRDRLGRWRGLLLRLGAVLVGLAPFVAAEIVFVALDWGRPTCRDDPFVGFSAVHPLFVPSADGARYEIAESRQGFFRPDSFAAEKGPDEFRIFCLGGSTVQGRPFAIETSFTTWLQLNLQAADPRRQWKVVNCGGISYASYRLVPILEEVLGYEPDLVILYTGHNEFLEDREYGHIRDMPRAVAWPWERLTQTRTYNLVREGYVYLAGSPRATARGDRPVLGAETDAMLDYRDGFGRYHRDDKWRRDVIEHFRFNVGRMVQMARSAGVAMILMNPVCNLRDAPPLKSQHRDGLAAREQRRWESLCREAEAQFGTDVSEAVELLGQAAAIDDQYAGLHYSLAKCYDALKRTAEARKAYTRAKELDVCPLRILEPMNDAILDIARRTGTPLVDVWDLFAQRSRDGIPGGYLLIDHVHPTIAGHRLIADALTGELARLRIVRPVEGWEQARDAKARRHLESLDDFYFAKGTQRLEAVRGWATGQANVVRPKPDASKR